MTLAPGVSEAMLVDKIAVAYWRLRRATRAEVGELRLEFDKAAGFGAVVLFSGVADRFELRDRSAYGSDADHGRVAQQFAIYAALVTE